MTDAWHQWELRLSKVAAAAEAWQQRTRHAEGVPPRSALGGDDTPNLRVSGLAWYSLIVAVEHLEFTLAMMRATSTMYPSAYLTTLRSALLAASHAAWILSPSRRAERRGRAMRLQVQDLNDQLRMVRSATGLTADQLTAQERDEAHLESRLASCAETVESLGLARSSMAKVNNTEVITEAAKQLHDDPVAASGVQLLWRVGSAAAHGQRSYAIMRMNRNVVRTDGTKTVMELRGDLEHDVGPSTAAAALAVNEAFRLFDLRCGHTPDPSERLPRFADI
jgi:hypothetical protein